MINLKAYPVTYTGKTTIQEIEIQNEIADLEANTYIPLYAAIENADVEDKKFVLYYKLYLNRRCIRKDYCDLIEGLKNENSSYKFQLKTEGKTYFIDYHRGLIGDNEQNILLCLALKSEYFVSKEFKTYKEVEIDYTKFALFISPKLKEPQYKNLYKHLKADYIDLLCDKNVDIIMTNEIEDWVLKSSFKTPKYKTLTEMQTDLKCVVQNYLTSKE